VVFQATARLASVRRVSGPVVTKSPQPQSGIVTARRLCVPVPADIIVAEPVRRDDAMLVEPREPRAEGDAEIDDEQP
jgi:hypothetical protein